jgi:hypothetical protein
MAEVEADVECGNFYLRYAVRSKDGFRSAALHMARAGVGEGVCGLIYWLVGMDVRLLRPGI